MIIEQIRLPDHLFILLSLVYLMVVLLEKKIIESIQDGPFIHGVSQDEMDSGGLGPCIAVGAIYRKQGFMVHTMPWSSYFNGRINSMLDAIHDVVRSKRYLGVYAAGGAILPSMSASEVEDTLAARTWILSAIASHGFARCLKEYRWGNPHETLAIRLFLEHGKGFIEANPDEDFADDLDLSERYYEEYFGPDKN